VKSGRGIVVDAVLTGTLVALGAGLLFGQTVQQLSEVAQLKVQAHQLRVENARLRSALAAVQADLDSERLTDERAALEQQLRDEIKPPAGHVFDWTAGAFAPPPPPSDRTGGRR
jgi:hypothetical protein